MDEPKERLMAMMIIANETVGGLNNGNNGSSAEPPSSLFPSSSSSSPSSSSTPSSCDPENMLAFLYCSPDPLHLAGTLVKIVALSLIIICTVFGNVLVLMAVALSRNLRSSTHYLIVNLAVADLLLGTTVLPFSAVFEITGRWYFGQTFCVIWAAVDVLCCTSSILSLCVISLDRYIGVTRPLAYSSIMVGKRTSILILVIWTLSFAISIGPLLGWREEPPEDEQYYCTVTKQMGYVFFSATGSFYLPMLIILSVYWKIYKAAIRQTKFLESGQKTTKQDVTLRIHLGGGGHGGMHGQGLNNGNRAHSAPELALMKVNPLKNGNAEGGIMIKPGNGSPLPSALISVRPELSSAASSHTDDNTSGIGSVETGDVLRVHRGGGKRNKGLQAQAEYNCNWTCISYSNGRPRANSNGRQGQENVGSGGPMITVNNNKSHLSHLSAPVGDYVEVNSIPPDNTHHHYRGKGETGQANSMTPSPPSSSPERKLNHGFGKIAKFRRQKKAAKTLAIVVGVFLVCWFPFFLVLPMGVLCENCIPEWMFNLCFWLGYFNSCLNPVIYACTSREFQRAFRRILCRRAPPHPHLSRAIYRANNINTPRFIERDYNNSGGGIGVHMNGNGIIPNGIQMMPANQWR